jgi:hypothetical protein
MPAGLAEDHHDAITVTPDGRRLIRGLQQAPRLTQAPERRSLIQDPQQAGALAMYQASDNAPRFRGDQLRSNHEAACTPATAFFSRRAPRPVVHPPGKSARPGASSALAGPFQNYRNVNLFGAATTNFVAP